MLLKCHHVLHLVLKFETMENQPNDEIFCLDIFEMTIKTNELVPKSWQIGNYRYFIGTKLMQRTLSVLWNGGENMNPCFQLLFSLLVKSLGLWDCELKLKRIFPWLGY